MATASWAPPTPAGWRRIPEETRLARAESGTRPGVIWAVPSPPARQLTVEGTPACLAPVQAPPSTTPAIYPPKLRANTDIPLLAETGVPGS